jgi:hypothetical protein
LDSKPLFLATRLPQRTKLLNSPQEPFKVAGLPPPVSKAVTNQPDIPAGTGLPGFGKHSIPGNLHIFKEHFRCPKNGGCEIQIGKSKNSALVRNDPRLKFRRGLVPLNLPERIALKVNFFMFYNSTPAEI